MNQTAQQEDPHLPYPHLAAFIQRQMGNRFGKRVKIEIEDQNTLGFHQKQMAEKQEKAKKEKEDFVKFEADIIQKINDGMEKDAQNRQATKAKTQAEFKRYNDDQLKQREIVRMLNKETSNMDCEEYFPYIHGDMIEEQREIMNHYMAEDLRRQF